MKEIPLHQEMVSVTGSVTWISHSSSVIGMYSDPRRQRDEIARPSLPAEKNRWKQQEARHNDERRCRSPSRAQAKGRIPRFTDRRGKKTESVGYRSGSDGNTRRGTGPLPDFRAPDYPPGEKKKERGYSRSRDRLLRLVGELLFHPLEAFPVIDLLGFMDGHPEGDRPAVFDDLFEPGSLAVGKHEVRLSNP